MDPKNMQPEILAKHGRDSGMPTAISIHSQAQSPFPSARCELGVHRVEGLKGAVGVAVGEKHSLAMQAWYQGPLLDVTWAGQPHDMFAFSSNEFPELVSLSSTYLLRTRAPGLWTQRKATRAQTSAC